MSGPHIIATSDDLTVNGACWHRPPRIEELCEAMGAHELIEGDFVIIAGKRSAQFKYFEDFGLSVLLHLPDMRVKRISIHMKTPRKSAPRFSPYGNTGERPTKMAFAGCLELNGCKLQSPLPFRSFPLRGELDFENLIAIGKAVNAHVGVRMEFVDCVSLEFRRTPE